MIFLFFIKPAENAVFDWHGFLAFFLYRLQCKNAFAVVESKRRNFRQPNIETGVADAMEQATDHAYKQQTDLKTNETI